MNKLTDSFIMHVKSAAKNPTFTHHSWFVKYHLEVVEKIALELCRTYPNADKNIVLLLVWLHDYGKIIDFKNQYKATLTQGKNKLQELGFPDDLVNKLIAYIEVFDKKRNLEQAPLEVKIVSSADGASHFVGPFFSIFWKEHPDWTEKDLIAENKRKAQVDWNQKIVLPEIKKQFLPYYKHLTKKIGKTKIISDQII